MSLTLSGRVLFRLLWQPEFQTRLNMPILIRDKIGPFNNKNQIAVKIFELFDFSTGQVQPIIKISPQFFLRQVQFPLNIENLPQPDNNLIDNIVRRWLIWRTRYKIWYDHILIVLPAIFQMPVNPLRSENLLPMPILGHNNQRRISSWARILLQPTFHLLKLILVAERLSS